MFSTPFVVLAKFDDSDAKATNSAAPLMLGCSLNPFPGVIPSAVETRVVDGVQAVLIELVATPVQVSRM
jgi:hypothetical protein